MSRPSPLGVTLTESGANVAVWAPGALAVWLCVFSSDGGEQRIPVPFHDGGVWHGAFSELTIGSRYGFRVAGPGRDPRNLLIDPYARAIDRRAVWDPRMAEAGGADGAAPVAAGGDTAAVVPRSIVLGDPSGPDPSANRPRHAREDLVIYEAHAKGLTALHPDVPEELRGTYAGLAHPAIIEHLTDLGVTAIELLPLQTFLDDQHVVERGLTNYWGYQPIAWHAPEPRYASRPDRADSELRAAVHALHEAGIEVILDVVYNHTGEGGSDGPTLSLRGFTPDYYRSAGGALIDDTGTGNTVAAENPMVLRLILDSLRHWATRYGIDGFRFDLASAVGRGADGFDAASAFFQAAGQDPVLSEVRLIAEPWDLGPGGYQLGGFPHPWAEWNDAFRDDVRRAWRGDPLTLAALSARLLGSARQFDHGDRSATSSVNFISAHDGFTLADVVSYGEKHNEANGEGNRDGHGENVSDGLGAEGPTSDPMILAARSRRARAMLATLFVSQGTPMLLAGDELGNSQSGNNNAYAQDNPVGWVDWSSSAHGDFVRQLIELRRRTPILRQGAFLHSELRADGDVDVTWLRADGSVVDEADWQDPQFRTLVAVLRGAAVDPVGESLTGAVAVILNPGPEAEVRLPSGEWEVEVDSAGAGVLSGEGYAAAAQSVVVLAHA
ncbi:glycogen debranching protein GlgX [Microbacterium gubbeenense]|uniref:glycogen debranching protein GlgX n=1 Tax=Microbacterium gubbeenense TaxID=159896 RepID=UPI003F9B214B